MNNHFAVDFAQNQSSSSSSPARQGYQHGGNSAGYIIKSEAAHRYYDYHSSNPAEKNIIFLGINGILDLGNDKTNGQIPLFEKEEWGRLLELFPTPNLDEHYIVKDDQFIKYSTQIEQIFYQKKYSFAVFRAAQCDYQSDADVPKLAAFTGIFSDVPGMRTSTLTSKYIKINREYLEGETQYIAAQATNNTTVIKTDLRIIDNNVCEYSTGEFALSLPEAVKISTDRNKLLIEGKFMLNRIVGDGLKAVLPFHVAGLEAKYRDYIDTLYDDHRGAVEKTKRNKKGLWCATNDTPSSEEAQLPDPAWVREGWMYPRENSPLPPPPASFIS
ncbi:hypothetical protein BJV82DRAFT_578856 [Fennellomyces sp. T-0311]|nr:hypothetical protein BJV82DRAFT_578856 [Fennellomyces sp. T-0311]